MSVDVVPRRNILGCIADNLVILDDRLPLADRLSGDLVAARNRRARGYIFSGDNSAGKDFSTGDNDIVTGVQANGERGSVRH